MEWTQITVASVISVIITWLARPYLGSYVSKKGENRALIEDLDKINHKLEQIKSEFVGANAYATEKAKGLATKEDVEEITRKVEGVKSELTINQELIKWELSKKAIIHRLAAEKEFAAMENIGKALVELQLTTRSLRPTMDFIDPNEHEEERHKRRYNDCVVSRNSFFDNIENHKLFMPQALYITFLEILRSADLERFSFESAIKFGEGKLNYNSYKQGEKNREEMDNAIFEAIKVIRRRCGIEG